ncbi:MAG: NTP transferase domain-containing protein [Candidatus Omnitrophota bacterium]
MNTTAVILAAGRGTRMNSQVPKVLHQVGSRPILERVISSLKKAGVKNLVTVVGYKAELVEKAFKERTRFSRQPELLGSGHALACAVEGMDDEEESILVTCGDSPLITARTYKKLIKASSREKNGCVFLTCLTDHPGTYGRIVRDSKGNVLKIVEEKDADIREKQIKEVNAGTYCFGKTDLKRFIKEVKINTKKKEFYLTDIVGIFRQKKKNIETVQCCEEEMIGINTRKDLAVANKIVNKRTLEKLMKSGVTIADPDTTQIDETAVIGRDTIVFSNTVVEKDVIIGEACKIGPFARLRGGTKLSDNVEIGNFVEICRTKIGKETKVKHHTYLGDTTVGSNVNIGAGVSTANYDGKEKNRTVIEDRAFIGVGAILIAPVRIGHDARVGAGAVVTKNKDVGAGETVVGVPARPVEWK